MVLVFALSAALCLRIFVLSDRMSRSCEERDNAVIFARNAAETVKSCGGDLSRAAAILGGETEGGDLTLRDGGLTLVVSPKESGDDLLGRAAVTVHNEAGEPVVTLSVAWQEVGGNE